MKKQLLIGLFVYLLSGLLSPTASAATMTGDNYSIDQQSVQIQPFIKEQPKPKDSTEKPLAQGTNYTVETTSPEPFSFGVSTRKISFGTLQPTNPVLRKLILSLDSKRGYQVLTAENHPLRIEDELIIPDTTCDNGSCSNITAALWVNALTYGFGYHLDGMEPAYFQHFPDSLRNEAIYPLSRGLQATNHEINVTYKVNVSGTQEVGSYTNIVTYIATPDF